MTSSRFCTTSSTSCNCINQRDFLLLIVLAFYFLPCEVFLLLIDPLETILAFPPFYKVLLCVPLFTLQHFCSESCFLLFDNFCVYQLIDFNSFYLTSLSPFCISSNINLRIFLLLVVFFYFWSFSPKLKLYIAILFFIQKSLLPSLRQFFLLFLIYLRRFYSSYSFFQHLSFSSMSSVHRLVLFSVFSSHRFLPSSSPDEALSKNTKLFF